MFSRKAWLNKFSTYQCTRCVRIKSILILWLDENVRVPVIRDENNVEYIQFTTLFSISSGFIPLSHRGGVWGYVAGRLQHPTFKSRPQNSIL